MNTICNNGTPQPHAYLVFFLNEEGEMEHILSPQAHWVSAENVDLTSPETLSKFCLTDLDYQEMQKIIQHSRWHGPVPNQVQPVTIGADGCMVLGDKMDFTMPPPPVWP